MPLPRQSASHVFVVHGDLRALACDDVVVPVDAAGRYTAAWRDLLDHVPADPVGDDWVLRKRLPANRRWQQVASRSDDARRLWILDSGGLGDTSASWIAEGLDAVLTAVAAPPHRATSRERPLVALPLVGSGEGGFRERRDELISAVLDALETFVAQHEMDVALVLWQRPDHEAVQHGAARGSAGGSCPTPSARRPAHWQSECGALSSSCSWAQVSGFPRACPRGSSSSANWANWPNPRSAPTS